MNATDWSFHGPSRSVSESCAFSSEAEGVESSDALTGTTGCILPVGGAAPHTVTEDGLGDSKGDPLAFAVSAGPSNHISPPLKRIAVATRHGDPLASATGPQQFIPSLPNLTAASPVIPGRPSGDGRHITQVRQARHARVVAAPKHHMRRTPIYGGIRW